MDVSIVSGTYDRLRHLQRMVESVRKDVVPSGLSYEFILVDGGSDDGTLEWCKRQSDVRVIEHGALVGAVKAFNDGFKASTGKYIAILNDDVAIVNDTITRAYKYLEQHPCVAQVAFENRPVADASEVRSRYSRSYGYLYGQCCLTRRWISDVAGWWGDYNHTYGGDGHLSLALWERGWSTVEVEGCAIVDWVVEDRMRKERRTLLSPTGKPHENRDIIGFMNTWNNRLPQPDRWIPASCRPLAQKAVDGTLRTLRFRHCYDGFQMRRGQFESFKKLGPSMQVNDTAEIEAYGRNGFQRRIFEIVDEFKPDIVIFQAHYDNNVRPETVNHLRNSFPGVKWVNYNGDYCVPMEPFHFEMARAVDLQMLISPDLFSTFHRHGAYNVAWLYPAFEPAYSEVARIGEYDREVLFLGNAYGHGRFPEADTRCSAVVALERSGLDFKVYGGGWDRFGIKTVSSGDHDDVRNAQMYARAKITLSINQARHLYGYTSNRQFFACATGCATLVQRFSGMEDIGFADGETCIVWDNIDEMVDKARYYVEHDDEREAIGQRGRSMVLDRHNYDKRVATLIDFLEVP